MKSFRNFSLLALGVSLFVVALLYFTGKINFFDSEFFTAFGIALFYATAFGLTNKLFFSWLGKKFSWETQARTRFALGAIGSVVFNFLTFAFCRFAVNVWFLDHYPASAFLQQEDFTQYIFPLMLAMIIALGYHAFIFYKTIQDHKIKQQKIITAKAEAQFKALENQLDPHFLFNSLNVLTALIEENPSKAQKFTASLSEIYRYVLEKSTQKNINLSEEITFAKTYMKLMKMRFEDSIHLNIKNGLFSQKRQIVPLSLQMLLENAIKHNRASAEQPLEITIDLESNYLNVSNTRSPKPQLSESPGFGLKNIKERYALLTKRPVKIEKNTAYFTVKLPLFE